MLRVEHRDGCDRRPGGPGGNRAQGRMGALQHARAGRRGVHRRVPAGIFDGNRASGRRMKHHGTEGQMSPKLESMFEPLTQERQRQVGLRRGDLRERQDHHPGGTRGVRLRRRTRKEARMRPTRRKARAAVVEFMPCRWAYSKCRTPKPVSSPLNDKRRLAGAALIGFCLGAWWARRRCSGLNRSISIFNTIRLLHLQFFPATLDFSDVRRFHSSFPFVSESLVSIIIILVIVSGPA